MERRRFGGGGDRHGGGDRRGGFGGHGGGGFGRGGGGGSFDKPKPVKIGEEYDVEISDVGARGDGICKVENFIVFVNGAKKGEKCRIRIKEVANKFAIADKVGASEGGSSTEEASEDEAEEMSDSEESGSDEE